MKKLVTRSMVASMFIGLLSATAVADPTVDAAKVTFDATGVAVLCANSSVTTTINQEIVAIAGTVPLTISAPTCSISDGSTSRSAALCCVTFQKR